MCGRKGQKSTANVEDPKENVSCEMCIATDRDINHWEAPLE